MMTRVTSLLFATCLGLAASTTDAQAWITKVCVGEEAPGPGKNDYCPLARTRLPCEFAKQHPFDTDAAAAETACGGRQMLKFQRRTALSGDGHRCGYAHVDVLCADTDEEQKPHPPAPGAPNGKGLHCHTPVNDCTFLGGGYKNIGSLCSCPGTAERSQTYPDAKAYPITALT